VQCFSMRFHYICGAVEFSAPLSAAFVVDTGCCGIDSVFAQCLVQPKVKIIKKRASYKGGHDGHSLHGAWFFLLLGVSMFLYTRMGNQKKGFIQRWA
jgi:hypothetical protein